jgi:hypothetical protein
MKTSTLISKIEQSINLSIETKGLPYGKQGYYKFVTPFGKFTVSTYSGIAEFNGKLRLIIKKLRKGLQVDKSIMPIVKIDALMQ